MTRVRVRDDIRLEYIITSKLSWSCTRQPQVGQAGLRWGPEKGKAQSISADVVEAEIVSGDIGLTGGLRVVPFKCERTYFTSRVEDLRAK